MILDQVLQELEKHKGSLQYEADEIIHKNPPGVDRCCRRHRYDRFPQNQLADRDAPHDPLHPLDDRVRDPHRDNHLVRAGL